MASDKEARIETFRLDRGTCQHPQCTLTHNAEYPRQFFPTGEVHWDESVLNGDWMVQISHLKRRDYQGLDAHIWNADGSRRVVVHDTLCHAKFEIDRRAGYREAFLLVTGQTIRTLSWIIRNGDEDEDVPLGFIWTDREIREINNHRRAKLRNTILRYTGRVVNDSVFYSIGV